MTRKGRSKDSVGQSSASDRTSRARHRPMNYEPMLWGRHAVVAALANPKRAVKRLFLAPNANSIVGEALASLDLSRRNALPIPEALTTDLAKRLLPAGAVHQGVAATVAPLPPIRIEDLTNRPEHNHPALVVLLDQVTDPQNVGAILRSAAFFGVSAVVIQSRNAPPVDGTLAKAASGALESIPLLTVTNICRTLDDLKKHGFWCVGLSGDAEYPISRARLDGPTTLVLGAEGSGLRRLTRKNCDQLVYIPASRGFTSLNVSNAAAIALFEARQTRLKN
ncbi:MAG: 23S rRNA (guanosine(2251)-2'-O)-methyltransferase RlmB [Rhodospirillaceae bacterium]|nr:23S rRNA (guanosine(2251)-2'-O)-methyltransferase RlmB [Rhodospirillaceae bacterium]